MKWLLIAASIPIALAVLVLIVGLLLPKDHVARAGALIDSPPDRVAAIIRDVEGQVRWRAGVSRIEILERGEARLLYVEHSNDGAIRFDFAEEPGGRRFHSIIADPELPFGGGWTIDLAPEGEATRVSIEERGSVRNPIYRFFSAVIFGHERTMKDWLADLGRTAGRH